MISDGSGVNGRSVTLLSDPVEVIVPLNVSDIAQSVLEVAASRGICRGVVGLQGQIERKKS